MRIRVEATSAKTPPPAFTTKVLPLYMRMYGAAFLSARIARAWSPGCMIMSVCPSNALQHAIENGHLRGEAVVRFPLHDAARAVEDFVRHGDVAPHRQTVHQAAIRGGVREPIVAHAPMLELAAQLRVGCRVSITGRRAPLLRINDMRAGERLVPIGGLPH